MTKEELNGFESAVAFIQWREGQMELCAHCAKKTSGFLERLLKDLTKKRAWRIARDFRSV